MPRLLMKCKEGHITSVEVSIPDYINRTSRDLVAPCMTCFNRIKNMPLDEFEQYKDVPVILTSYHQYLKDGEEGRL